MSGFSKKDIFVNHLKLHTESFGKSSNPACVLIAGKMSTARFWTDAFCQYLASQGFFIIRYDHRDVGKSSEIDWQKAPYTMSDLAKDAISVIDGYGIKKAHFIGDSMGGWICQRIGVDYPEKVLSLVIISAGPIEITKKGLMDLTAVEQEFLDHMTKMFLSVKNRKTIEEIVQNLLPVWRHANAEIPFDEEMAKAFHGPVQMALHSLYTAPFWLALAGVVTSYYMYMINPAVPTAIKKTFMPIFTLLENKYYLDWFNENVLARGARGMGMGLWKVGDQAIIDGAVVNGSWKLVAWLSSVMRRLQSGFIYDYAFGMIIGVFVLMTYFVWLNK